MSVTDFRLDNLQRMATKAIATALTALTEALAQRDAASDAAGQALADAGVPPGVWVNGIRYFPVEFLGAERRLPGQYNVEVQALDGSTRWLSSSGQESNTRRVLTRAVDATLKDARASVPVERRRSGAAI